jgi:hypothetical protein
MHFCKLEPLMRAALLSLLCVAFVVGCKVKNPNYCEDNPDHLCDMPDAPQMQCDDSTDCTGTEKVCKKPENVCVQCTMTEASACMGTKPICNTMTNTCQACAKHTDCPDSNTCLPDGSCAAAANVLYVKQNGTDTATCAKAAPCGNVMDALMASATKSIIRVEGTIAGNTIIINNRDLTILGDPNTSILNRISGDLMSINGSSKVRIYDLKIADAAGNIGINVLSTHTGELELQRCVVTNNGTGILVSGNSSLIVSRSTISLNSLGGINMTSNTPKWDITNNFIFRNGNENSSQVGGIAISATLGTGSRLEFNTIVDNDATSGGSRSGGVQCTVNSFPAPNNLVARNELDGSPSAAAQVNGGCNFAMSLTQLDFTNIIFVNPATVPFDYHIKTGSSVIDMATGGAPLTVDVDGQARPNGTARDMGADEFYAQ